MPIVNSKSEYTRNKTIQLFACCLPTVVFILVIYEMTPLAVMNSLRYSLHYFIKENKSFFHNLSTPNSGNNVLPPEVQQAIQLLDDNKIATYNLSNKFFKSNFTYQRIIEGCWPHKYDPASEYKLIYISELKANPREKKIIRKKDIALVISH